MIENDRQLEVTKYWAGRFKEAIDAPLRPRPGVDPLLIQAERDALQSQYQTLLDEIAAYERARGETVDTSDLKSDASA